MNPQNLITVLQEQVRPALGCTEPVAIALACAKGAQLVGGAVNQIAISTSKGLFKNAHAVGIPKTEEQGILIAAALGALAGDADLGLEVLKNVTPEQLLQAKKLVEEGKVTADFVEQPQGVYVEAMLITTSGRAKVCISGNHNNISLIEVNNRLIYTQEATEQRQSKRVVLRESTIEEILQLVEQINPRELSFLLAGVRMNKRIAKAGMEQKVGLGIGAELAALQAQGILGADIVDQVKTMVAAASDARMGGVDLPVMTSCGSGNQGIVAILPVALLAERLGKGESEIAQALAISHLINAYVKEHLGKLSPICGCSVSAGLGATAAMTKLLGGNLKQIQGAMQSIIANLSGTLCDGAKGSCSLKLATAAGEAIICSYLAVNNVYVATAQGIVGDSIEDSINNLSLISKDGMSGADDAILEVLLNKTGRRDYSWNKNGERGII